MSEGVSGSVLTGIGMTEGVILRIDELTSEEYKAEAIAFLESCESIKADEIGDLKSRDAEELKDAEINRLENIKTMLIKREIKWIKGLDPVVYKATMIEDLEKQLEPEESGD